MHNNKVQRQYRSACGYHCIHDVLTFGCHSVVLVPSSHLSTVVLWSLPSHSMNSGENHYLQPQTKYSFSDSEPTRAWQIQQDSQHKMYCSSCLFLSSLHTFLHSFFKWIDFFAFVRMFLFYLSLVESLQSMQGADCSIHQRAKRCGTINKQHHWIPFSVFSCSQWAISHDWRMTWPLHIVRTITVSSKYATLLLRIYFSWSSYQEDDSYHGNC